MTVVLRQDYLTLSVEAARFGREFSWLVITSVIFPDVGLKKAVTEFS